MVIKQSPLQAWLTARQQVLATAEALACQLAGLGPCPAPTGEEEVQALLELREQLGMREGEAPTEEHARGLFAQVHTLAQLAQDVGVKSLAATHAGIVALALAGHHSVVATQSFGRGVGIHRTGDDRTFAVGAASALPPEHPLAQIPARDLLEERWLVLGATRFSRWHARQVPLDWYATTSVVALTAQLREAEKARLAERETQVRESARLASLERLKRQRGKEGRIQDLEETVRRLEEKLSE